MLSRKQTLLLLLALLLASTMALGTNELRFAIGIPLLWLLSARLVHKCKTALPQYYSIILRWYLCFLPTTAIYFYAHNDLVADMIDPIGYWLIDEDRWYFDSWDGWNWSFCALFEAILGVIKTITITFGVLLFAFCAPKAYIWHAEMTRFYDAIERPQAHLQLPPPASPKQERPTREAIHNPVFVAQPEIFTPYPRQFYAGAKSGIDLILDGDLERRSNWGKHPPAPRRLSPRVNIDWTNPDFFTGSCRETPRKFFS